MAAFNTNDIEKQVAQLAVSIFAGFLSDERLVDTKSFDLTPLRGLEFGHFETVKPGEVLDFSLGKSFLFFCWPRKFVRCNDVRKWSHYIFRAVH